MTTAETIERRSMTRNWVIEEYIQPGPRDAQKTLDQLIEILDNPELYGAIVELLEEKSRR